MPVITIASPPPVMDVQVELLRETDEGWGALPPQEEVWVGDRLGAGCFNLGQHRVVAAVLVRDMSGALRAPVHEVWELEAGGGATLAAGSELITVLDADTELVVALSPDETALRQLLLAPQEAVEGEAVSVLGLPFEVRLGEDDPDDADYDWLLRKALNRASSLTALEILTLLPLPNGTRDRVETHLREALLDVGGAQRGRLIEVAVNLDALALRRHLRGMAADGTDPDRAVAIRSLAEVGDPAALDELRAMTRGGGLARAWALRWLAVQGEEGAVDETSDPVDDPVGFWMAIAAAQRGRLSWLDEVLSNHGSAAARQVVWDPAARQAALRELRPLPESMRHYLADRIERGPSLSPSVRKFTELLIRPPSPGRSLTAGVRPVPERLVGSIRSDLQSVGGLAELASFQSADARGWRSVESMDRGRRGVLLAQLLELAVVLPGPRAVEGVADLVARWATYDWYPDLDGAFRVGAVFGLGEEPWGVRLVTQQLGWVVSRAPFTVVLRHLEQRLANGSATDMDLEIFRDAALTRHDSSPPARDVVLRHLPGAARRDPIVSGPRPWQARAWLEDGRTGPGGRTARLGFGIWLAGRIPEADERELTVILRARGGVVRQPVTTVTVGPGSPSGAVIFDVNDLGSRLSLQVLVYLQDAGVPLLELAGELDIDAVLGGVDDR